MACLAFMLCLYVALSYLRTPVRRPVQAWVFHSVAKQTNPQRCRFLPEKLCTTRQERKGPVGWVETGAQSHQKQRERGGAVDYN